MPRYIFLSLFALLLLTGCESSDTDTSSKELDSVFENTTGAKVDTEKEVGNDLAQLLNSNPKSCPECNLAGAQLSKAHLSNANLAGANLEGAWLWDADLTRARLEGAQLFSTTLTGANLTNANLTGAFPVGANLWGANLRDVIGADFTDSLGVQKKYLKD